MLEEARSAKAASHILATLDEETKNKALLAICDALKKNRKKMFGTIELINGDDGRIVPLSERKKLPSGTVSASSAATQASAVIPAQRSPRRSASVTLYCARSELSFSPVGSR